MAKEVYYRSWCDQPGCREEHADLFEGQETQSIEVWVYTPGKGRKPNPVRVEMCAGHAEAAKVWFAHLSKFNQKGDEA